MANKELSELQSELETLKEENKQTEVKLLVEQDLSRVKVCFQDYELICRWVLNRNVKYAIIITQVEEVGCLLMAINNLAEQCYLAAYGPLENMNMLTMMDMVKVISSENYHSYRDTNLCFFTF